MTPAHLFKIQIFLTDVGQRDEMFKAMSDVLGDVKPANTLLVVKSLARPEILFEVEGIAAAS